MIAPDLLEAYDTLQFFHDILDSSHFSVQSEELTEWIKTYAPSDVEEVRSAVVPSATNADTYKTVGNIKNPTASA